MGLAFRRNPLGAVRYFDRGVMQDQPQEASNAIDQPLLSEAAIHLKAALSLLDKADAPGHVGAHVDLAICQLEKVLQKREPPVRS